MYVANAAQQQQQQQQDRAGVHELETVEQPLGVGAIDAAGVAWRCWQRATRVVGYSRQ
jgi:hypothetical protein